MSFKIDSWQQKCFQTPKILLRSTFNTQNCFSTYIFKRIQFSVIKSSKNKIFPIFRPLNDRFQLSFISSGFSSPLEQFFSAMLRVYTENPSNVHFMRNLKKKFHRTQECSDGEKAWKVLISLSEVQFYVIHAIRTSSTQLGIAVKLNDTEKRNFESPIVLTLSLMARALVVMFEKLFFSWPSLKIRNARRSEMTKAMMIKNTVKRVALKCSKMGHESVSENEFKWRFNWKR